MPLEWPRFFFPFFVNFGYFCHEKCYLYSFCLLIIGERRKVMNGKNVKCGEAILVIFFFIVCLHGVRYK